MKNPRSKRLNAGLYFFSGGASAATVANSAQGPQTWQQEQPQINQAYGNQFSQFTNWSGVQPQQQLQYVTPLIQQASQGAQNFYGQMFGPGSGIGTGIANAQNEIATGGYATPEQARDTNQATLAAASAAGSAFSPTTLGQMAINEDAARQARVNTAYGQLGAAQGLQTGALNQLTGTAQSGVGALQGEVGAFTGLTDPILSFLSNMFGQNTQANIAQAQLQTQASLANQAKTGGAIGGAVQGAGSILGALALSDERVKTNIEDTGEWLNGVPYKTFEYITRPGHVFVGPLAQDVEKVEPESVTIDPVSGVKMVDTKRFPIFPMKEA